MEPTDEELLHTLYAGDKSALDHLAQRLDSALGNVARVILQVRTGSQELREWDIDERLARLWDMCTPPRKPPLVVGPISV